MIILNSASPELSRRTNVLAAFKFEALSAPVKRIFSFGVLDCENSTFYLLNDLFVNKDHQIVHIQKHEPEEYMVEMMEPNTARNKVYLMVCNAK